MSCKLCRYTVLHVDTVVNTNKQHNCSVSKQYLVQHQY